MVIFSTADSLPFPPCHENLPLAFLLQVHDSPTVPSHSHIPTLVSGSYSASCGARVARMTSVLCPSFVVSPIRTWGPVSLIPGLSCFFDPFGQLQHMVEMKVGQFCANILRRPYVPTDRWVNGSGLALYGGGKTTLGRLWLFPTDLLRPS